MPATGGCGSGGCGGQGEGGGCGQTSNGNVGNGLANGKHSNGFAAAANGTNGTKNGSNVIMCTKCKTVRAMVYMESGGRCFPCLQHYLSRLFRFALGRANASGPSAHLAVAVSGGYSSATVAHLAYLYLESIQRAPGQVSPPIVLYHSYTDESALAAVEELADQIPRSQLRIINVPSTSGRPQLADRNDELLLCNIELRKQLLRHTDENYKLLFGTNATRNSARILEAIVHGRPGISGAEAQVEPLVGVRARLLFRYARRNFPGVDFSGNEHHQPPFLQAISRFIIRAEADNSSAVHNVVSTVSKLTPVEIQCNLCSVAPTPAVEEENNESNAQVGEICAPCRGVLKRAEKKGGDRHTELMRFIERGVENL